MMSHYRYINYAILSFLAILFCWSNSFAQVKGIIYESAQSGVAGEGAELLDPNGDGFVSSDNTGFTSNDEAESELSYIALPTSYSESDGDISHGGTCSHVDLVNTAETEPLYFYSDGVYLFFRFRLGGSSGSTKTYSVFIDSDEKFGFLGNDADPNAVTGNPGFEVEVALHTNGGVAIYDVDGTVSPVEVDPPYKTNRPANLHSQKAVAYTTVCDDNDYFYDYYVSFADLALTSSAIDNNTLMRMVGQSGISANALTGSTSGSDLAGIDDDTGNGFDLMGDLVTVFPPVSGNDLSTGDPILPRATCPVINSPIDIDAIIISGTSSEIDETTIEIFENGVSLGITSVTSGSWEYDLNGHALTGGLDITATAVITDVKTVSRDDCSPVTVEQICSEPPSIDEVGGYITSGTQGLYGTSSETAGTIITIYEDVDLTTQWDDAGATISPNPGALDGSGDWIIERDNGGGKIADGVYYITAENDVVVSECESDPIITCVGVVDGDQPIISTSPILESTATLTGTNGGTNGIVDFYINDVFTGINTTANASGIWSLSISGHNVGDGLTVRATESGFCTVSSAIVYVQEFSIPALILGDYCAGPSGVTSISGISSEPFGSTITLYTGVSSPVTKVSPVATSTVNADGTWTVDLSGSPLGSGTYVAVSNTNTLATPNELESELSNEILVLAQTDDVDLAITTLVINEGDASISGEGTNGNTIQLFIDDELIDGFSAVVSGMTWTIAGLDAANAGFDVLYPGGLVSVTSLASGKCVSVQVDAADVIQCKVYAESNIAMVGSSSVCVNETIDITFDGSENLVFYQLYTDASATIPTGSAVIGDGGNITITTSPLSTSITNLYLKASRIGVDCDFVFSTNFNIVVKGTPAITLVSNSLIICDDASSSAIEYTGVTNGALLSYDINFDTDAEAQGFVDINDASVSSQLTFDVPSAAAEGSYTGTISVSNSGEGTCVSSNYNFSMKIIEDIIDYGTSVSPTCLNNDGSIEIMGLKDATTYQLNYEKNSGTVSVASITSDGSGNYLLDNISGGSYNNFNIVNSGCASNTLSATKTMVKPLDPILNITSSNITEGDVSVSGTGTDGVEVQLYIDDVIVTGYSSTVADGEWTISGLDAVSAGTDLLLPGGLVSVKTSLAAGCTEIVDVAEAVISCKPFQNNAITLLGNTDVCANETRSVSFAFSQEGVVYQLVTDLAGLNTTGSAITGDGNDIILTTDPLSSSLSQLYLKATRAAVGCSKVFSTSFNISVKNIPTANLLSNDFTICNGTTSFTLNYTDVTNGPLSTYDLDFNGDAEIAGFADVNDNTLASQVVINIPLDAPGGAYAGTLTLANSSNESCSVNNNFTFEIINDEIAYGTISNPSCLDTDGNIEITGLQTGQSYDLNYEKNGSTITVSPIVSDASGNYLLDNITSGSYTNYSVSTANCNSNVLTATQSLIKPSDPVINISSTNIIEGDVSVSGTGTDGVVVQLYIDDVIVTGYSSTVVDGEWIISGLDALSASADLLLPGGLVSVKTSLASGCTEIVDVAEAVISCKPFQNNAITLLGNTDVCANETLSLSFAFSQVGVVYQLVTDVAGLNTTGNAVTGDGNDIILTTSSLSSSVTQLYLKATRAVVGCSKVFSTAFSISVKNIPSASLVVNNFSLCKGTSTFTLNYVDVVNGPLVEYDIDFNGDAELAGFVDIVDNTLASQIIVNIPTDVTGGSFGGVLTMANSSSSSCTVIHNFTFDIVSDEIAYGTITNPSCLDTNGSIEITGLQNDRTYELNYEKNGTQLVVFSMVSDVTGNYLLENLASGSYANISVSAIGCMSNILSATQTLIQPSDPVINISSNIIEGDAVISGTGTNGVVVQLYIDDVEIPGFSTTVLDGEWSISGLDAASAGSEILLPGELVSVKTSLESGCNTIIDIADAVVACRPFQNNVLTLIGNTELCVNETVSVSFAFSETGVNYQLFSDISGLNPISTLVIGNGADIILTTDPLYAEVNRIYLRASRPDVGCSQVFSTIFSISVKGNPSIVLTNTEYTICNDQTSIDITYTEVTNGPLAVYNLNFDAAAVSQNFVDINGGTVAGQITLEVPTSIVSGLYGASLVISNNSQGTCSSAINTFNFNVVHDAISEGVVSDPSECDGIDGSIEILGLRTNQVYELNYSVNNNTRNIGAVMANESGSFLLENLEKGNYKDINVQNSGCESNTLGGTVVLSDPSEVELIIADQSMPTNCLGSNGFITINGMSSETEYLLMYAKNNQTTDRIINTDDEGGFILDSLNNASYVNFLVERLNCYSNEISEEVVFACAVELYNTPVITPNGDGFNDYMEIEGIENFPFNTVSIFNRWGNPVWDISGYQNDNTGFGGVGNTGGAGGHLTDGTYFIVIDLGDGGERHKDFVVIKR
ncbi:MAG: gliding motility-associated C-terminal domain-containing protein [Reichenbachiella sp.]